MSEALYAREWRSVIRSKAWLSGAWTFERDELGNAVCNVPRPIIHHSPDGFEWGYHGSGPADLALCLAHAYIRTPSKNALKLFKGRCAELTWACHQDLKRYFVAGMPKHGTSIKRGTVLDWLVDWCRRQQLLC